ncbi:MAG: ATP-dependent DNA helicase, partial [Polyangiales bacterium]
MTDADLQHAAASPFSRDGTLANALPGFEARPSQMAMAQAVADALAEPRHLLIEAGTGTGKTLAYLIPALQSGQRVVISTATLALQEQLRQQALPVAERAVGRTAQVAVVKGLRHYLCRRRYQRWWAKHALTATEPVRRRLQRFADDSHEGDHQEVLSELPPGLWEQINSGPEVRLGSPCPHFDSCFVTQLRARTDRAELIIVNHHLFFADLSAKHHHGSGILPDYDAVIFDEAHQIEDIASHFFGTQLGQQAVQGLARELLAWLAPNTARADLHTAAEALLVHGEALFAHLAAIPPSAGGRALLDPGSTAATSLSPVLTDWLESAGRTTQRLTPQLAEDPQVALWLRRLRQLQQAAKQVLRGLKPPLEDPNVTDLAPANHAVWVERRARSLRLGSSPVDVAELFQDALLQPDKALIFTSATLSTGGHFRFVRQRWGLPDDTPSCTLPSPFDYSAQAALYVPTDLPLPAAPDFAACATDRLRALIELTGGGALILCTSHKALQHFTAALRRQLDPARVLAQGEASAPVLLDRLRQFGDAVLVATASFWEGVDVAGPALRLVVIDKLPFDVPTDPMVAMRCRHLEAQGQTPFRDYLLPGAALALKQGFGRLIRSSRDHGIVAVLDKRLLARGYGSYLRRSLPPARLVQDFDALQA